MKFEFATAGRILFASGAISEIGEIAAAESHNIFLVHGKTNTSEKSRSISEKLQQKNIKVVDFAFSGEPTTTLAEEAIEIAKKNACTAVLSIGGGSVLDLGKAVSAMLTNSGELMDYLEVVGKSQPLKNQAAPFIAIPTTAGSGTEVTRNAVLLAVQQRFKVSLRSPLMIPKIALVDPQLTLSLPKEITANTGMDALSQLIEPFVSIRANAFTDMYCLEGIKRIRRSILKAVTTPDDLDARQDMSFASLLGGLCLANAGLGAVHGFAAPLGGMFPAPHGAVCARLLPEVFRMNTRVLKQTQAKQEYLARYEEISRILVGREDAGIDDGISWLESICSELGIKNIREYGIQKSDFPELVQKAALASSMKANPVVLTNDQLQEILERTY